MRAQVPLNAASRRSALTLSERSIAERLIARFRISLVSPCSGSDANPGRIASRRQRAAVEVGFCIDAITLASTSFRARSFLIQRNTPTMSLSQST